MNTKINLNSCYQLPVKDTNRTLLAKLLKSLNSSYTDEVAAAANAIFATYRDAELIAKTIWKYAHEEMFVLQILS